MEKLVCCAFLVACGFLFFNSAVAEISCYSCNSHFHPDCGFNGSPLNESYVRKCGVNDTLCRKIHQWVDYTAEESGKGPDERLVRECGTNQTRDRPYYYRQGLGGRMEVFTCFSKLCNAADFPSLNVILISCVVVANLLILNSFK